MSSTGKTFACNACIVLKVKITVKIKVKKKENMIENKKEHLSINIGDTENEMEGERKEALDDYMDIYNQMPVFSYGRQISWKIHRPHKVPHILII